MHYRKFTKGIFAWLVILTGIASVAAAQGVTDLSAKVIRVKGSARYTTGNNNWQPLKTGTYLQPGTIIQTAADNSSVDLALGVSPAGLSASAESFRPYIPTSHPNLTYNPSASANVLRIWENSALGIDKLTMHDTGAGPATETMLDLKQGRISGVAKKISAASKFEIKLPKGVAAVRGTTFDLMADGVVKVFEGSVMVAWVNQPGANVVTQLVARRQKYDARNGELTPLAPEDNAKFESIEADLLVIEYGPSSGVSGDLTITPLSPVTGSAPQVIESNPD